MRENSGVVKFPTPFAEAAAALESKIRRLELSLPSIRNAVAITSGKLRKK